MTPVPGPLLFSSAILSFILSILIYFHKEFTSQSQQSGILEFRSNDGSHTNNFDSRR